MFAVLMACFAVAMSVAALAAAWLTISGYKSGVSRMDFLEALARSIDNRVVELTKETARAYPETLRAEVDDLRAALDVSRASYRKELGSLWGRLGGKPSSNGTIETVRNAGGDFEALLDLQARGPVGPQ
jgi:hypothetical protein